MSSVVPVVPLRTPFPARIAILAMLVLHDAATASAAVTFDWATVGNPGNAADTLTMSKGPNPDGTAGYGTVGYAFKIATTHVTNAQYVEFLNAVDPGGSNALGLYDGRMTANPLGPAYAGGIDFLANSAAGAKYAAKPGKAQHPAVWLNWNMSARFVNWLHNGQGSGGTENGAYDMSIATTAPPPRQPGAAVFLPSEDEFYKAAYYDPGKNGVGGYWQYGVRSDSPPTSQAPPGGSTAANMATAAGSPGSSGDVYWQTGATFNANVDYLTGAGAYGSAASYYGLKDVDGNAYQWTEGTRLSFGNLHPVYRGGAWYYSEEFGGAAYRNLYSFRSAASYAWFGLRVAGAVGDDASTADFNGDGMVDGADLRIWETGFGDRTATRAEGDANADGRVDGLDLIAWQSALLWAGPNAAAASAATPEPTTGLLLLAAATRLPRARRRLS